MSLVKTVLFLLSANALANCFGVYYDEHLQCDENALNPNSTTCTFTEAKGDQKTMWHYEPQPDTVWTYKIQPKTIWRVIFANCHFPEIPKGLFEYFENVKTVVAKQSGIIGIFQYTLKNALYLQRLELPYNNITALGDKIFSECSSLMYLDISSNQIEKIGENAFYGLTKLKTLDLQWNRIKILHSYVFITIISIEVIMLNNNQLVGVSDQQFAQNTKLSHIDLSNNHMTKVSGKCFEQLSNLTILNLSNNKLREFSTEYFYVKKLYLVGNVLEVVYIYNNIEYLYVNDNYLKELKIKPGVNIYNLFIKNNSLVDISSITTMTTLKGLDLSNNPIGPSINTNSFSQMVNLESLDLGYCSLKQLPTNIFANLQKLKMLDVTGNHLGYFDATFLSHMSIIDGLYLDENDLVEFNFNVIKHKFNNFSELGLSNNNFDCNYLKQLIAEVKQYHIRIYFAEPVTQGTHVDYIRCFDTPANAKAITCDQSELANKKCFFKNVQGGLREHYRYNIVNIIITEIEYITFVNSQIKEIPKDLFHTFTHVKYFYVTECYIEEIYEYTFAGATFLLIIDLSGNNIKELKPQIFIECISVMELNLVNNDIIFIADNAFEGMSQLKELHLSNNQITTLNPKVFYYLIEITYIELDGNHIEALDENLFQNNRQLREVNLSKNKLHHVPKYIFKSVVEEITLYIEYNYIETFTEEIPNVKKVYLTGNKIEELRIPRDVQQLKLENSKVKTIQVTEETILTELILKNNSLTDISNLGKLKNLEILDLSNNQIQYLQPQVFQKLNKLKSLRLHECQITTVDTIIFTYLIELQILDLSGNKLNNFDLQQLAPLQHLETLNLEHCGLNQLNVPMIQNQLPALKEIAIDGNNWDCGYLRELVIELRKRKIKRYVVEPVLNGSNVEGIGCIEGLGQQMPPDVGYIDKSHLQRPMPSVPQSGGVTPMGQANSPSYPTQDVSQSQGGASSGYLPPDSKGSDWIPPSNYPTQDVPQTGDSTIVGDNQVPIDFGSVGGNARPYAAQPVMMSGSQANANAASQTIGGSNTVASASASLNTYTNRKGFYGMYPVVPGYFDSNYNGQVPQGRAPSLNYPIQGAHQTGDMTLNDQQQVLINPGQVGGLSGDVPAGSGPAPYSGSDVGPGYQEGVYELQDNSSGKMRVPYSGPDVPPSFVHQGGDNTQINQGQVPSYPTQDIHEGYNGQGSGSCCAGQGSTQVPNCCEEIVEIRAKVKQLEEEIGALREGTKREVTIMLDAKSAQIANELKAMVKKLLEEHNTGGTADLHSRFMFQES